MDTETSQEHIPKRIDPREQPSLISSQIASQDINFFRSCSLCANGAAGLSTGDNRVIEVFGLPHTENPQFRACSQTIFSFYLIQGCLSVWMTAASVPVGRYTQSGSILGTLWYPTAVPEDPSAFCFLASIRDCPVKLLDASDGRLRASYRIVDHRERQIAPYSMAFNNMASKLYCGFQDAIEVFDVNYPGEGERIYTTPFKKSKSGMKGIISALAFCPDYSGLYAAGTFSASLVMYAESNPAEIIQSLRGIKGPVTQVKFNPTQPHLLYATSRQTHSILSWDIRGDTSIPLQEFERPGHTNQRLTFDLDVYGTTIATGDTDGFISCFELNGANPEKPIIKFKAHNDAVAATVFHPLEPNLLSVSGSRHFDDVGGSSESGSSSDDTVQIPVRQYYPVSRDTSIKLWAFQSRDIDY